MAISALLLLVSCGREEKAARVAPGEIEITGLSDSRWTYWSFSESKVIGSSEFGSKEEDLQWAGRKDWDIAICGDLLRTNSGTSGSGEGGIQRNNATDFFNLTEAPEDGYIEDNDGIVVKR